MQCKSRLLTYRPQVELIGKKKLNDLQKRGAKMNKKDFYKTIKSNAFRKAMEEFVADLKNDKIKTCYECMAEYEGEETHPVFAYYQGQVRAYEYVVEDIEYILKGLDKLVETAKEKEEKAKENTDEKEHETV